MLGKVFFYAILRRNPAHLYCSQKNGSPNLSNKKTKKSHFLRQELAKSIPKLDKKVKKVGLLSNSLFMG